MEIEKEQAVLENEIATEKILSEGQKLIPWVNLPGESNYLLNNTERTTNDSLDSFYLFPLTEVTINNKEKDIPAFLNERYQTILSVAYRTGITVATIFSSRNGRKSIYLGFKRTKSQNSENDIELFQSIINGILPGKKIKYDETIQFSALVTEFTEGGMITGIPLLKKEDKDVGFKISSVIRSLYNRDYTLALISNPIPQGKQISSFNELLYLRDQFHSIAKQTKGKESGTGQTVGENNQETSGTSKTSGHSVGGTIGIGIPISPGIIGGGGFNYNHNWSNTKTNSESKGTSINNSVNRSKSLSYEQQNGLAVELEKISEQLLERMTKGINTGLWETSISFSTKDKITSEIIGGSFVGELSKPSEHLLPPSQFYCETLPKNCHLFLPKSGNQSESLFPKKMASYITSEELSLISSPPTESLSGFEIKKMPTLAVNDIIFKNTGFKIGLIADYGRPLDNSFLRLSTNDLNKHLFISGLTGSGKSTTVKHILKSLWKEEDMSLKKEGIPFLVLESAKRDYRQLLNDSIFDDNLNIFTVGSTINPIRFNPFYIQEGVDPLVHIDYLKAIFNASFSLYGPMPAIVEKCIHKIYLKKGWNLTKGTHPNFIDGQSYRNEEHYYCFPTLTDLKSEVENYVKTELAYKGELQDNIRTAIVVRLESLCVGAKGMMFDTYDFFSLEKLLNANTILEMESLADDDDKAFFVGLMLVLVSQYRQRNNPTINPGMGEKGLKHFMVIEEAHRLLKNVDTEKSSEMMGNPKGKAVELFANVISEMRSLGQGVAVVEQIPSKISPDVIKNSNTKIVHRLVSKDDQSLLAGSLSISEEDALYLNRLITGHALIHKEGMERPVECAIINDIEPFGISDSKVQKVMYKKGLNKSSHPFEVYEISQILNKRGKELVVQFLNSLCTIPNEELKCLISIFKSNINQQIKVSGFDYREELFSEYSVKQILILLNHGIYQKKNKLPAGLKESMQDLLNNQDLESLNKFKALLEEYWGDPARKFISKVVAELTLKYKYQNEIERADYNKTIRSFFFISDEKIIKEVGELLAKKNRV